MTAATLSPAATGSRHGEGLRDKVGRNHLGRRAIVYVRQSTLYQTKNHRESPRVQYALVQRVAEMGWAREQTEVIDEDLGHSGTSIEGRPGFQRLVEQVKAGQVGLVMGLEMSRLCRSSLDWQALVQLCALQQTLLGDQDALYDPTHPNDRLFLGLKGAMSEFELHILRLRMEQGKKAKAARGELSLPGPMGYVKGPEGRLEKDPDEQARSVMDLLFAQFERLGSARALLRYLLEHRIELPCRPRFGPNKGKLQWRKPKAATLYHILRNPLYSGQYVFGRERIDPAAKQPGRPHTGRRVLPQEQWQVHLPNHHPAYLSVPEYKRNLGRLAQNRPQGLGASREGPSLLAGLLRCAMCGASLTVSYHNNGGGLRYSCIAQGLRGGKGRCQSLVGEPLERAVEQQVLAALEPACVKLSLAVLADIEAQRHKLHQHWLQRLQRARYEAELRERRYEEVDPKNRLVALSLERRWEEALEALSQLEQDYHSFQAQRPARLSAEERRQILSAARDLPALWHSPTTTQQQRKELVRLLIDQIEVRVQGRSERVQLCIHWAGGQRSEIVLRRPVARIEQLSFYPALLARLEALQQQDLSHRAIAEQLNLEGFHTAQGKPLRASNLSELQRRAGLRKAPAPRR